MTLYISSTIFLLLLLVVFLTVPVPIGVYVYRDARRRKMNAALWTLISIVAPALIGFIRERLSSVFVNISQKINLKMLKSVQ